MIGFFLQLYTTKGWGWCKHNAELVECAAALRNLWASGGEWRFWFQWIPETNMLNKSLFVSASHFANIWSWKAGSPTSNSLLLKAQSRQLFVGLQQSHSTMHWQHNHCIVRNLGDHNSMTTLLLCITQCFSAAATKGWAWCHHLTQGWWSVLPLSGSSSFWYE